MSFQDFYLDEPERIQNNCLIFFSMGRNAKNVIYPKSSGIIICQDFYLDKPERILIEQTPIFFCVSKC